MTATGVAGVFPRYHSDEKWVLFMVRIPGSPLPIYQIYAGEGSESVCVFGGWTNTTEGFGWATLSIALNID